jgi:hypothetical protein
MKTETELVSETFFKKLHDEQSPPLPPTLPPQKWEEEENCHLSSFVLYCLFWISLPLKMGPIGCPETSV